MVLLRNASCRPGWGEAPSSTQATDRANGESEGGGGPQYCAPDVLPGSGGSRQEKDVHAPLQRGQCQMCFVVSLSQSESRKVVLH